MVDPFFWGGGICLPTIFLGAFCWVLFQGVYKQIILFQIVVLVVKSQ